MNLSLLLLGGVRFRVAAEHCTYTLNICLTHSLPYTDFRVDETDGSVSFLMPLPTARRFMRLCRASGVESKRIGGYGIPLLLWHMRRRAGAWIGLAAAVTLLVLSGLFVWDVDVTGNESMATDEVMEILRACDFGVGSYIPSVKVRELENRILLSTDRIAWISVFLDGTVAHVQIVERIEGEDILPSPTEHTAPANLVATADGVIEWVQVYRGEVAVVRNQAVQKGDLLVSGIYTSQNAGFRYTRAAGEVWARTERTVRVEIPLSYTEKQCEEQKTCALTLNFFNFSLEIFKNTGNVRESCDIINKNIQWTVAGMRPLPVSLMQTLALSYTEVEKERLPDEALMLAYGQLDSELATLLEGAELLEKRITTELTDTAVVLHCTVRCIENIAAQVEFEIG